MGTAAQKRKKEEEETQTAAKTANEAYRPAQGLPRRLDIKLGPPEPPCHASDILLSLIGVTRPSESCTRLAFVWLPGVFSVTDISPFSVPGRFWRGNLHTHSTLSDGARRPEQVAEAYESMGYDFLMLSEHFIDAYDWPIADTRKLRSNRFTTILGAEVHAPETSVGELWHIVAAGLPLDFAPCGDDETGEQLARRAHAAGAFVAIAHPSWSQLTIEDGRAIDCAHAVEIYNHGCAVETDRGEGWYLMDQLLNEGKRLTAIATDDAHFSYGEKED